MNKKKLELGVDDEKLCRIFIFLLSCGTKAATQGKKRVIDFRIRAFLPFWVRDNLCGFFWKPLSWKLFWKSMKFTLPWYWVIWQGEKESRQRQHAASQKRIFENNGVLFIWHEDLLLSRSLCYFNLVSKCDFLCRFLSIPPSQQKVKYRLCLKRSYFLWVVLEAPSSFWVS